jgi:hypothetical protein
LRHLFTTERTFDAIAQGELRALGLGRKVIVEAVSEKAISLVNLMTGRRPLQACRVLPEPLGWDFLCSAFQFLLSTPSQLPTGDCSHLAALRHGAASPLLIGVCNHTIKLCRATAHRLGPFSGTSSGSTGGISVGISQYGLALANDRSAALDECRSPIVPVTDSFSSAPTCSWDALMVFRIFRANQIPAPRKAIWLRRFPSAYQLLAIQAVNSFMASPLDWDRGNLQLRCGGRNWQEVQETGKCFSCPGSP